jgi:nitrate reductase (cytochrome), electron transfer subunit
VNGSPGPRGPNAAGLVLIGTAVVLMGALVVLFGAQLMRPAEEAPGPHPQLGAPGNPIDSEASVFALQLEDLVSEPTALRRNVHTRTLAAYRALRAYPGAPPSVPHGLTSEEFMTNRCNTCHLRGGYVSRFASYAPVTPHPELAGCLQCHAADDAVVGISLPDGSPDALCAQCHAGAERLPPAFAGLDWRPASWPEIGASDLPGGPPVVPHDFQLRGNCLACHAGPGATEEIRTTHPERANCRQCHLPAATDEVFVRRAPPAQPGDER